MTTRLHPLVALRRKMSNGYPPSANNVADKKTKIPIDIIKGSTEVLRASYVWQLEDFENMEDGEIVVSPPFGVSAPSASAERTWCLQLYTRGDSDKARNYVSLYVQPLAGEHRQQQQQQLEGKFLLALLTGDQKRSNEVVLSEAASLVGNRPKWGISKFLNREVLKHPENDYLPKGTLTVYCEVTINDIGMDDYIPIQRKLHSDFSGLLENSLFSDVTLKVEGKEFKLHKNILAARSKFFLHLFSDTQEQCVFTIDEVDCKTMRHLLQFIYGEEVNISSDIAIEMLIAAEKFQLHDLKFYCQEVICEDINIGNVAHLHVIADGLNAVWLRQRTLNFIIHNAREVLDTKGYKILASKHTKLLDEIFRVMVKWQSN